MIIFLWDELNRDVWCHTVRCDVDVCKADNISKVLLLVQGVGRRYANLVCKKADIDMNKRAGELTDDEVTFLYLVYR